MMFSVAPNAHAAAGRGFGAGVAGFCLLLAVLASGSAVFAWQELKTNEAFLSATLKTAADIVDTAVAQAEKYRVPRAATLELLTKAEGLFDDMARYARPTPELQYRKAWMLIQFARNYAILGDTGKERAHAEEAYHLLAGLAAANPDYIAYRLGPHCRLRRGRRFLLAPKSYSEGLAIVERLAQSDPGNARWRRDLSVSYDKVGDVQLAQGNLPEALKSFRDGLAIRDRLAKADPGNAGWQRDLSVSYDKVGDVLVAQGDLPEALTSFRDGLAIGDRLAKADPGNAGWQRDLSVSYIKVGDVLVAQGNLPEAVRLCDGLAIGDRLAKADPGNAGWQRDLRYQQ